MRRPGIVVISGYVKTIDGGLVTIENEFQNKMLQLHLECDEKSVSRLKLQPGAAVIASTTDDFRIEMLLEGGILSTDDMLLKCYTMRYNGSFDFEKRNSEKEAHVFAGTLISGQAGTKDGYTWNKGVITWKKKGQEESRNLVWWNQSGETFQGLIGKRIIVITGEARAYGQSTFFHVNNIFQF